MAMGFGLTLYRFFQHLITEPIIALEGLTHSVKDIIEILFFYFTELSLTACYIIPFILTIRFIIRKTPRTYSYILWGVVYLKLISVLNFEIFNYGLVPQYQLDKIYHYITPEFAAFYSSEAGIVSQVQSNFTAPVPAATPIYIPALIWFTVLCVLLVITTCLYQIITFSLTAEKKNRQLYIQIICHKNLFQPQKVWIEWK